MLFSTLHISFSSSYHCSLQYYSISAYSRLFLIHIASYFDHFLSPWIMELDREFFISVFFALVLSFLVAKLVSAILAPYNGVGRAFESNIPDSEKVVMEELKLRANWRGSGSRVVESVHGKLKAADGFEALVPEKDFVEFQQESEVVDLPSTSSSEELGTSWSGEENAASEGESGLVKEVKIATSLVAEEVDQNRDCGDDERIGAESGTEDVTVVERKEIGFLECQEENWRNGDEQEGHGNEAIKAVNFEEENREIEGSDEIEVVRLEKSDDGEKEVRIDGDEDDWEGIERSDLEKLFVAAVKYVGSGDHSEQLTGDGSDVQMELYGLHKVATEGPCHESQPMAFRVSARAYWNAWQRLGNMNPDVAMERYIALLSDKIPGWMNDSYAGDNKPDILQEGATPTRDPNLSSLSCYDMNFTDERKPNMDSMVEGDHLTETSDLVKRVKE